VLYGILTEGGNRPTGVAMKKTVLLLFLVLFSLSLNLYGQATETYTMPPFPGSLKLLFHDIGWNVLHSFTYNYGTNFILAGLGTYVAIESGFDLYWRNLAYDNTFLAKAGIPAVYIGVVVPVILPFATYLVGLKLADAKVQILGFALLQSLALTTTIQAGIKMITGRAEPYIDDVSWHTRGTRDEDYSGTFDWFSGEFRKGWPSGHFANAIGAAAVIAEIYKDNLWLKVGAYSYAALMGLCVSVNVHWASDIIAGGLIGYAIGKTVGRSFSQLFGNSEDKDKFSLFVVPNRTGITVHMAIRR